MENGQKQETVKTTQIFEVFLDLCKELRRRGFEGEIYLLSSYTSDYGNPIEPRIKDELESVKATYLTNVVWALSDIAKVDHS